MKKSKLRNIIKESIKQLIEQQGSWDPNTGTCSVGGSYTGFATNAMGPRPVAVRICLPNPPSGHNAHAAHFTGLFYRRLAINQSPPIVGQRFCSKEALAGSTSGSPVYGPHNVAWVVEEVFSRNNPPPVSPGGTMYNRPELPGFGACYADPNPCYNFLTWGTTMQQFQCCQKCEAGSATPGSTCHSYCNCCADLLYPTITGCLDPNASNTNPYLVDCAGQYAGTWGLPSSMQYGDTSCCQYDFGYSCGPSIGMGQQFACFAGNAANPGLYPTLASCQASNPNIPGSCGGGAILQPKKAPADGEVGTMDIGLPKSDNSDMDYDLGFDIEDDLREEINQCEQEGFCCKNKLSLKTTNPLTTNGVCGCPKGFNLINC